MKKIFYLLPLVALMACGEGKPEEEIVELKSYEDKLSYALGAMTANDLKNSLGPNFDRLDKDLVVKGYKSNLNESDPQECMQTFQKLFGPYGQDFDTTYAQDGAKCAGRVMAADFYRLMKKYDELKKITNDKVIAGFRHALYAKDTLIAETDKNKMLQDFFQGIEAKKAQELAVQEKPYWEKIKGIKDVQLLESGVYLETVKPGKNGSPNSTDDVEAHYTLTNALGDTLETSVNGDPLKINLGRVIKGWTIGFPAMKKGGQYRLYVPSDMAYGNGALCFQVEFINYGAQGTLVKPQMPNIPQGM